MTILVTGAAGFIGSNFILNWLSHYNKKVIALDKLTYAGNLENFKSIKSNPNFHFIQADIGDSKNVAKILIFNFRNSVLKLIRNYFSGPERLFDFLLVDDILSIKYLL